MYARKFTPDFITHLEPNQVFVFGSNEAGIHGAGAAKAALRFGARFGRGYGMWGNTYAIPTKDGNIRTLPLHDVENNVNDFIDFAQVHPENEFLVTPVGCGLAGYDPEDIAPLFKNALPLENIILPESFVIILEKN